MFYIVAKKSKKWFRDILNTADIQTTDKQGCFRDLWTLFATQLTKFSLSGLGVDDGSFQKQVLLNQPSMAQRSVRTVTLKHLLAEKTPTMIINDIRAQYLRCDN